MSTYVITEVKKLQQILRYVFTIVPIVAGLDKFTNILTDWSHYLSPKIAGILSLEASKFMMVVGVIEIVAGIIVFFKTHLGAYIVSLWLLLIALSLLFTWNYVDVAVRDLVMAISAFTLAKLTQVTTEDKI